MAPLDGNERPRLIEFKTDVVLPLSYSSWHWSHIELIVNLRLPWIYTEHTAPERVERGVVINGKQLEAPCYSGRGAERRGAIESASACHLLFAEYRRAIPLNLRHKVFVIGNPVAINPAKARPAVPAPAGKFRIITGGRLEANKNQILLLRAFALIARDFPEWELYLYGSDHGAGACLRDLIRACHLGKRVFLRDYAADYESELLQSHICVMPSFMEGFPLALAEAMACALPVVALQSCPGAAALIEHEVTGLLAPDHSPESLAAILRGLMKNDQLRLKLGAAARESMKKYAPDKILDAYEALFARAIALHGNKGSLKYEACIARYYHLNYQHVYFNRQLAQTLRQSAPRPLKLAWLLFKKQVLYLKALWAFIHILLWRLGSSWQKRKSA